MPAPPRTPVDPYLETSMEKAARSLTSAVLGASNGRDDDGDELSLKPGDPTGRTTDRFLGAYSRKGILTALDRLGVLQHLAQRGYPEVDLEISHTGTGVDEIKLLDVAGGEHRLLVCFRACIDESSWPFGEDPMRALHIDWLSMESPADRFNSLRPQLPGQRSPGLHMGRIARSLVSLMARRLHCDLVSVVPERLYLAMLYRRAGYLCGTASEDRELEAASLALRELSFAAGAWAGEWGLVRNHPPVGPSRAWAYRPRTMYMPVSARAITELESRPRLGPPRRLELDRKAFFDKLLHEEIPGLTGKAQPRPPGETETTPTLGGPRWLVAYDDSPASARALHEAASALGRDGGEVTLVHAVSPYYDTTTELRVDLGGERTHQLLERVRGEADDKLKLEAERAMKENPSVRFLAEARLGLAPETIVAAGSQHDADVIVVGTHGRKGLERLFLGSVAEKVARDADRPVLLVPLGHEDDDGGPPGERATHLPPRKVAVCVDVSIDGMDQAAHLTAVETGLDFAHAFGSELLLLHVAERAYGAPVLTSPAVQKVVDERRHELLSVREQRLDELVKMAQQSLAADDGPSVSKLLAVAETDIASKIAEVCSSEAVDLVVAASHSRRGFLRLLGSVAGRLARRTECPVLIVSPG